MHEEFKNGLNSGNACYCLVQNLCSCNLLSKNIKIKVYRTVTSSVVDLGMKLCLLHWEGQGSLRTGYWGKCLSLRGMRQQDRGVSLCVLLTKDYKGTKSRRNCAGQCRISYQILVSKPEAETTLKTMVHKSTILKCILRKQCRNES
jgi:hypothetical protein